MHYSGLTGQKKVEDILDKIKDRQLQNVVIQMDSGDACFSWEEPDGEWEFISVSERIFMKIICERVGLNLEDL